MEAQIKELLDKIKELETGHMMLQQEISKLRLVNGDNNYESQLNHDRLVSSKPHWGNGREGIEKTGMSTRKDTIFNGHSSRLLSDCATEGSDGGIVFSERHYQNILQCMGHSLHIFDLEARIIFWNRSAELLYGYSASEAVGKNAVELIIHTCDSHVANSIVQHLILGETWAGKFPVKNKSGERFFVFANNSPFYDDDDVLVGIVSVTSDTRCYQGMTSSVDAAIERKIISRNISSELQQPLQVAVASKITNLATKVTSKVLSLMGMQGSVEPWTGSGENQCSEHDGKRSDNMKDAMSEGANKHEGGIGIHKIVYSKEESLFAKNGIFWPWKRHGQEVIDPNYHFIRPWLNDKQNGDRTQRTFESGGRMSNQVNENDRTITNETSESSSSFNANSTSSSSGIKVDTDDDCLDYEIVWEDLIIGEKIGQGSCGTVYHALWYGSDVAIKVFSSLEYPDEVILSFRQEVSLMKRLRHPNILLFMGAVTATQRLCIVTEFVPRGSLFQLLQKHNSKLDWRRRLQMAMDIAKGMNYLHHCHPPILHRDLKSSNLLVDKNWTVKVADFGLSRLKHDTWFTTKTGRGTPQWMAPEVIRNEPSNEKCDVYSYGVILWEIVTQKIPWDNLNSMQVVGAVGFMGQRLDIPEDLDPQWGSIIHSCWHSEPQNRPTFQELLYRFKDLQKKYVAQSQMKRLTHGETTSKS